MVNVTNFNFCYVNVPQSQKVSQALEVMDMVAIAHGMKMSKINDFKRVKHIIEQAVKRN